jgi:diguanylate cyclase (GGDEF)-like protein
MKPKVVTAGREYSLISVIELMRIYAIGTVIIVSPDKKPLGIITESDIITGKTAGDVMSSPVLCLKPDDSLENASLMMATNRIRRIPVAGSDGALVGLLSYRDLTEDLRKNYYMLDEIIEDKANKDPLTGLFNKGYGMEQLRYHFELTKRIPTPMAVFIFDIDWFKKINDTYGHACGDRVLKTIGHIIKNNARTVDIVSRYGGEEFMITGFVVDEDSARILPERIRKNIQEMIFFYEGKSISITISAGIALWNEGVMTADDLFKRADKALYESKNSGRNKVTLFKQN